MYRNAARRPNGIMITIDPALNAPVEQDTVQCCHCDIHKPHEEWVLHGGFCRSCMKPICGDHCSECLPFEKKLDLYEKGKISSL